MGNFRQPWNKRKWKNGIIRPSKAGFIILGIVGLIFTAVGILAITKHKVLLWPPNQNTLLLLFPTIGILLLFGAFVAILRQWKFRGTIFRMETMPGVIGGTLKGILIIPDILGMDGLLDIRLVNEEQVTTGSGKNSHTHVNSLFEHQISVNIADYSRNNFTIAGLGQVEIPLEFTIPFDTKDETDNYDRHKYRWKLTAKADVPGLDMNFEFDVPVFRTEQSCNEITIDAMETAAVQEDLLALKKNKCRPRQITVVFQEGGEHYISKAKTGWLLLMGIVLLAIGIGLIGHTVSQTHSGTGGLISRILDSAFAAIPGFIGLGFLFIGGIIFLAAVLTMGQRDVCVADGAIQYRKQFAAIAVNKRIHTDSIKDITVKKCGSVNNKHYYAVSVEHNDLNQVSAIERYLRSKSTRNERFDVTLTIARDIADKTEALWLADKLKEQLGI